jgi:hypothetical protein
LNARPRMGFPVCDGVGVALAWSLLRLLRCDVALRQPLAEVVGMKLHAPFAFDDLRDPSCCPQLGGKAERFGILAQPADYLAFSRWRQLGRSAGNRLGSQTGDTVLLIGIPPLAHRCTVDAEKLRNFCGLVAIGNSLDCQTSASFEFLGGTSCSPDQIYA